MPRTWLSSLTQCPHGRLLPVRHRSSPRALHSVNGDHITGKKKKKKKKKRKRLEEEEEEEEEEVRRRRRRRRGRGRGGG